MNRENKPTYLQEKQRALKTAEQHILEIEAQLRIAQKIRDAILKDIALFHSSRAPIAKIPLELVALIFENWDDDPSVRNHTLCLVCKTWYNIVWNSPGFWSKILLRSTWEVRKVDSTYRFARLCHQKAQSMPLDIIIDFSAILSYPKYVARILDEHPDYFEFAPSSPSLFLRWAEIEEEWGIGLSYPLQEHYSVIATNHVKSFLYSNKEHTHRWRSLCILLPHRTDHDSTAPALYDVLGNMEGLLELEIRGYPITTLVSAQQEVDAVSRFPGLQRFTTDQDIELNQLPMNYSSLQHMCLDNHYASLQFLATASSEFVSLRSLELNIDAYIDPFGPQTAVDLPQLMSLKLSGEHSLNENVANVLNVPNLVRLHLRQHDSLLHWGWGTNELIVQPPPPALLTRVSMLLIEGPVYPAHDIWLTDSSYASLKVSLQSASALVCLKMSGEWRDSTRIQQIVAEVRALGNPLEFLEEIITVRRGQEFSTQDEAHYSFWWRLRDHGPLGGVGYSEMRSNEAGQAE
jgi:F-box-like